MISQHSFTIEKADLNVFHLLRDPCVVLSLNIDYYIFHWLASFQHFHRKFIHCHGDSPVIFFSSWLFFCIQELLTGLRRHVFKKKWCRLHIFSYTCRYHSGALTIKSTYAATKPIGLRFASNTRTTARTSRLKGNHVHHLATTSAIHLTKMFLTACLRERWHSCHVFKRHIFQIFTDRIIFVQTKMFSDPPFKSSTHQEIWNLIGATLGQQKYENKKFGRKKFFPTSFFLFPSKIKVKQLGKVSTIKIII